MYLAVQDGPIPAVGTRFDVHKHLYDGGTYLSLEVTSHEWTLDEGDVDVETKEDTLPSFRVAVHTWRLPD